MKNIFSLFKKSPEEERIEDELSGKPSATSATPTPPKRGATHASPASHTGAGAGELETLRASLTDIEAKLQATVSERDSLRAEFQDYRQAVSQDQRDLEQENATLKQRFHEVSLELSKQIAAGGLDAPLPGLSASDSSDGPKGLQRAIQANKQASTTPLHQRHEKLL